MYGAIIGDLAGSIYEYDQFYKVKKVKIKNLIEDNAFYSDDTILTVACAHAILDDYDYNKKLKEYALKFENYSPNVTPYFEKPFSPSFLSWAKSENTTGTSLGNGAMMRISPVANYFKTEEDVIKNVKLATTPSHNTQEAINCATTIALIIFYAKQGLTKQQIFKKLSIKVKKPKLKEFNYTCASTINLCLYSIYKTNNFNDAIKLAISFGGDTDTNACIVGSMAEALYGIDENLKQKAREKLPKEFIEIIDSFYNLINKG